MTQDAPDLKTSEPTETTQTIRTELDDSRTDAPTEDIATPSRSVRSFLRRLKPVPAILALLVLISGSVAAWLYITQYRPDQQTNPSVAHAVVTAASDGAVALLSYSSHTLDKDFANAKTHLGGDFLTYYDQFTKQTVAPAAKEQALKTTARVKRAAVSELHSDSAVVLLFIDQSTTSKDSPDPTIAASSTLVTMTRIKGEWLITKFNPV